MADFVHLHNHSHYSLLDGACRIDDLIEACLDFNMPALAITDHGNLFGAIEFYKKAKKAGIKPIIGSEVYVAPTNRFDRTAAKGGSDASFHLILLAKNKTGYQNLMKLVSIGYLEGFYYKPRIDLEVLEQYSQGLIALSACLKGAIPYYLLNGSYKQARDMALKYQHIFGQDFYLEVHDHGIHEEQVALEGLIKLSQELGIPLVACNDTHYLKREHFEAHDILLCLQTSKDRDDPKRLRYNTDQIYFKSPQEMVALFSHLPQALENTLGIAEKCSLELDFNTHHLPRFSLPEEAKSLKLEEYFKQLARQGLKEKYVQITPAIAERLEYELEVIERMGYAGYFLIVKDFIDYARSKGIPVGPGRGSAAGSLVSYALGITNVDPLKYNLIFERFLNPERITLPDIDIDFCYERRGEIIEYVKKKYGENNVSQIITFGTMAARAVIRDVGRVLKMSYADVDRIAKMIPAAPGMTLDKALELVPELRELSRSDELHQKLIEHSRILEGLARHASTHAAGVVITPEELTHYTPLFKSGQSDVTTQYDMKSLEDIGVLKMDFLGLRTLTVIDDTLKALSRRGIHLDLDQIPLDDPETYKIFSNGETIGIFQFESSGMREYLKKLKPQCLEDLIAMNALYRPGPMEMIDDFIQRKHGLKKIEYLHPLLEPILKETYGVIVYQEQVLRIASELGGFSLGKADLLRRAMGKKKPELMKEQRELFIKGASERGIPEATANEIFDLMDKFAGYGFNKSHAAGYSLVAYQTAYLKAHYPAEFMAANLTSEMGNTNRIVILIEECRRLGLKVLPPDVNESYADFVVTELEPPDSGGIGEPGSGGKGIRFGLGAIKNVGKGAIKSIVKARQKHGKFSNIYEFCSNVDLRLVNKKVLESLIQAGAMDSLGGHRAQLLQALDMAVSFTQNSQAYRAMGQTSIFDFEDSEVRIDYPPLPLVPPWSPSETLTREKALLGFYVSGHPLKKYEEEVRTFSTTSLDSLDANKDGSLIRVGVIVSEVKSIFDRNNRPMAFITLEDFSGMAEALVFSDTYAKYKDFIQKDAMVMIIGRTSTREEEETKILCEEVVPLSEAWELFTHSLCLSLTTDGVQESTLNQVQNILKENKGQCPVYVNVKTP
ncbi:MAG: DNA polymerase III subunit alpha, partial [candidate division KSB1 bacterium]|nr:DNA polymerase III subunit alpha [candidate division KSB1 bacterium]